MTSMGLRWLSPKRLLWLGFGVITSILVAMGVSNVVQLRTIADNFEVQSKVAKPRSAVARELELNLLDYAQGVHQYLSGDDGARQRAAKDTADIARHIDRYSALAGTARQRELAARFVTGWRDLHSAGEALMAARASTPAAGALFASQVLRLEQFLDSELQPDAVNAYDALQAIAIESFHKSEIIGLALLIFGVASTLIVGRAILMSETGLRDSEARLASLNAALEQKVAERTQELRELNADLDQRVTRRTQTLADSQKKLRALVEQLTRAEEQERHRLATELHDYLGQLLAACQINLGRAEKSALSEDTEDKFAAARQSLNDAIAYTRTLTAQLSPQVLYDLGLPAALVWLGEQMAQQHGLRVEVAGDAAGFKLDEERAILAFQCARELLWNVVKHGATEEARVSYELKNGELTLEVADRGRGLDLANIESQAAGTGGIRSVQHAPTYGTSSRPAGRRIGAGTRNFSESDLAGGHRAAVAGSFD